MAPLVLLFASVASALAFQSPLDRQREELLGPQRRIAQQQAAQQREQEERSRREQILAAHKREAEQREEQLRALIARQREAEIAPQTTQPPESPAQSLDVSPQSLAETPPTPAAGNAALPKDRVYHLVGIALFACAAILAIGVLIRDRLYSR